MYSLSGTGRKIKESGVTFKSHIDGSKHIFTPENVMDIQRTIGADIIMAFDECTPYPCDYGYARESMEMTHRWLKRCCDRFDTTEPKYSYSQTLFPIVQGSTYSDLRKQSAETIASFEREGNAIGGLSVGEPAEMMYEHTEEVCDVLPTDNDILTWEIHSIRADASNSSACQSLKVHVMQCTITLVIQLDKITPSKTPEKPHRDFQGGVPPFFLFSSLCVAGSCLCSPSSPCT